MALTKADKQKVISENKINANDTGSSDVQIAVMTERIKVLTEHLKNHSKDFTSRRGLLKLVGHRSALLRYLRNTNPKRYLDLINKLGIRK